MKFNTQDLEDANARLSMLAFYPANPAAQAAIMELLAKMCPSKEALEWLVDAMVNRVGRWPGPKEMRGVLCTQFRPADGVDVYSTLSGFSPEDSEQLYVAEHERVRQLEKAGAPMLTKLLGTIQ